MSKKRGKKLKKAKTKHAEDRISNLPDVLLTCILSFLSTKDSVRTSVLSTRWKHVWVHVPALDLEEKDFPPSKKGPYGWREREKRRDNFLAFISRFLKQSNPSSFRRFCLQSLENYDQLFLEQWVCAAKNPNIEELMLDMRFMGPRIEDRWSLFVGYGPLDRVFPDDDSLFDIGKLYIDVANNPPSFLDSLVSLAKEWNVRDLMLKTKRYAGDFFPQNLFAFEMLVILSLEGWWRVKVAKASIHFPNLRILNLFVVGFADDESAANLITSCPVLEKLYCDKDEYLANLAITSATLKNLTVICEENDEGNC